MVAGADRVRRDVREHPPDADGRPLQSPGSRLRQGTRHSGDRLSRRPTQARPCRRIPGQNDGQAGLVSGPGWSSPGAGVGYRRKAPHRAKKADAPSLRWGRLYVNHYSFHILDPDWGHLTIKISGHPPFPAQVMLNGHEYVACQARKASIAFTKEGNCFTTISDAAGLAKIADTLSEHRAIGRLSQVCERWIYTCVCFALDFDEQKRSGFHYQYSNYQIEYSRNLVFEVGGHMEQVFQAL